MRAKAVLLGKGFGQIEKGGVETRGNHTDRLDVIVIGAGVAGLEIARRVEAAGYTIAVLEAQARLGGRVFSVGGVDLGARWLNPQQTHVWRLCEELNIEPRLATRATTSVASDPRSWWTSLWAQRASQRLRGELDALVAGTRSLPPHQRSWSASTWIQKATRNRYARDLFDLLLALSFGVNSQTVSMGYVISGWRSLGGVSHGATDEYYVPGGMQQLVEGLRGQIAGTVLASEAVTRIHQHNEGVAVETVSGKRLSSRRIAVAIPPLAWSRLELAPPLPESKRALAQMLAPASTVTAFADLDARWPHGELYSAHGLLRAVYPLAPSPGDEPGSSDGQYVGALVVGALARQLASFSTTERENTLTQALCRLVGHPVSPVRWTVAAWPINPWVGGGAGSVIRPGCDVSFDTATSIASAPVGRVHFAGAELSTQWHNHVEGALQSATACSVEICQALERTSN